MRYILAAVSFLIAACILGFTAKSALTFYAVLSNRGLGPLSREARPGFLLLGGIFILGMLFVGGGLAVLTTKPRRKE